jgi:hypothetical protein
MTVIDWSSVARDVETKPFFARRIRWERLALLAVNAALWGMIVKLIF